MPFQTLLPFPPPRLLPASGQCVTGVWGIGYWVLSIEKNHPRPLLAKRRGAVPLRPAGKDSTVSHTPPDDAADGASSPPSFKEGTGVVPLLTSQAASPDQPG